jgi:tetratricopeptide (TPR) repeat protein
MLDQLIAAFERRDYKTAATLVKQLQQQSPDNPWVKLYAGRLSEVAGKLEMAEAAYRQLLQETTNTKVAVQARQGLQRLVEQAKQQAAPVAPATAPVAPATVLASSPTSSSAGTGTGFLVLEAVPAEWRQAAAQRFAEIMSLDAYTAKLLLPSRGWKLYRTGAIDEIQSYAEALLQAEIPGFWIDLAAIEAIRVFRVHYFATVSPHVTIVCENESGQLGSLTFEWAEVKNRVEGRLPIFEDVVDTDSRNQLTRKEKTQDYAQVIDLHLPKRKSILRIGDWDYQFQQGIVFDASQDGGLPMAQSTQRIRWNQLVYFLDQQLASVPVWIDFSHFGETALDHLALLHLKSHINLLRKAPSKWDAAFQLYSGLIFEHTSQ